MLIQVKSYGSSRLLGQRHTARPIRDKVINAIENRTNVILDFDGVEVTQSFTDEIVGAAILHSGTDALRLISFKNCSDGMKKIIMFVIKDRAHQYQMQVRTLKETGNLAMI